MKNKIIYLILFYPVFCFAQSQYRFAHFSIKDGLSQNSVHCVFKDSEGCYWFGTQDGLNRYDGYSVKTYRHDRGDTSSISDNFILCITEDKYKNLWIGTRNGLNFFDKKKGDFSKIIVHEDERNYFHNAIWTVLKDKTGGILFTNHYGEIVKTTRVSGNSPAFRSEILKENATLFDISGETYVTVQANKIDIFNKNDNRKLYGATFPGSCTIYSACELEIGKILAATSDGLLVLEKNKAPARFYTTLQEKEISHLLTDRHKNIWAGTKNGLYVLPAGNRGQAVLLKNNPEDAGTVSGNSIQAIYEDSDGLIWVGTSESGVNIYDPCKDVFRIFNHYTDIALPAKSVWGIYQDKNELWVGTSNGLARFEMENESVPGLYSGENKIIKSDILCRNSEYPNSIGSNTVSSIIKDKNGDTWFGSHDNGLSVLNGQTKRWAHYNKNNSPLQSNTIFHLMCASDGKIWIATLAGFYSYDPYLATFKSFLQNENGEMKFPSGYIISIYEDRQNTIWVASTYGIYRLKNNGDQVSIYKNQPDKPESLSYNIVTSFLEDSKGRFWVATLGGGINLMDRINGTFQAFMKKDGLANDIAYCISEDNSGHLWISTNSGLSRFDPSAKVFTNFTIKDGLASNEHSQNACFKNKAGEMLFGSPDGFTAFHPDKIPGIKKDITIILTSLKVNYEKRNPGDNGEIELYHDDKTLTLEFSAPDFRRQDNIQYAFLMEGFDNEWRDVPASNRFASFTNLPYGKYTFRVRVREGNGGWQKRQLVLKIHVIPPFWKNPWFIATEIVLAVCLLVVLVKYFSQRKLRKKIQAIEMQRRLQSERERISRDLHDNVGSQLAYIITSLDNMSHNYQKNPNEYDGGRVESLGEFARSTMQQLRETIWAINKESVTVSELKEKVDEYLSRIFHPEEKQAFCISADSPRNSRLNPTLAIHLFRIIQEAVNNAMKYAEATNISIVFSESENLLLTVTISDNGKGISQNDNRDDHYGLHNMKARVKEMNGEFILHSEKNRGTAVKIIVPV